MQKINYNDKMEEIINGIKGDRKKKLLLHSCCAPCSSSVIERLKEIFDITVYYYNPNIDTSEEYEHRQEEQKRLCEYFNVQFIKTSYDKQAFLQAVKGHENAKEGGSRCELCFRLRLLETAKFCKENSYDYFATTLTVSPLKNSTLINQIGLDIASMLQVSYLPSDFKKKGGYQRGIVLSNQLGLYRQNYCGCEFSKPKQ